MTTLQAAQTAPQTTLATLIELIRTDPSLAEAHRREFASALTTVARVLNSPPHLLPADPAALREKINRALPTAAGVSSTRWRNVKSLLRRALALLDPAVIPARSTVARLPSWATLLDAPEAALVRRPLSRLSSYCSARGLAPQDVTQAVYDGFLDDLAAHCLLRSPRETHQAAGHAWNAARQAVPGWPQVGLRIPSFRRNPSLPWTAFPDSLRLDVEAWLAPHCGKKLDLRRDTPKLRATTMDSHRLQIRQFATAVVESGDDPASLRSLADLVVPETAEAGLMVLAGRAGENLTWRNHGMACLLLSVARHRVKADPATLRELALFRTNLKPEQRGMTAKNRNRLRQFDNPHLLAALLELPARMMAEACREPVPTAAEARIAQMALAIELLTMAPVRIKNLAELEIGRTLILAGSTGHISVDLSEVKNEVDLEIPLPAVTRRMIDTYLTRFHALLAPPGCTMLFPSRDSSHKRAAYLSDQISRCLALRCGIAVNAHLFRHLAAKIYLDAFPGSYGVVRMLLGHKSIQTTIRYYCGTEFLAAHRSFDDLVARVRANNGRIIETRRQAGR